MKKIFGGIDLNWKKLILFALVAGVYTALMAIIPQVRYTSFNTIAVTFEVWIFIGIFIIMNSKSNKDSALKCFVFFLISQPLVYLLQVPFSSQGWGLFRYYGYWLVWTILCLPMGYIGYHIKKGKWTGYLILFPMILFTAYCYHIYLTYFTFLYPNYILISIFCILAMFIYPNVLFDNKKIKIVGSIISAILTIFITSLVMLNPYSYSTELLTQIDGKDVTSEYQVALKDSSYGDIYIDSDLIHVDFKRGGKTELIVTSPEGKVIKYDLIIRLNTYKLKEKK